VVAVLAAFALVACSSGPDLPRPSRAFCEAAARYDRRIVRAPRASVATQIELVRDIAEHAPKDIRREAQVFLDALRRVRADPGVRDDPDVQQAVDSVNRRAGNGCGFFERDAGSGF
jgi:hypothetical protein